MLTLICPVLNEERYLDEILNFYLNSEPKDKEIFFIDGGSNDNSVQIIKGYVSKDKNIHFINNPNRFVPFALNLGVKGSNGDPIIRLDAHTIYPLDYCTKIIEVFKETGADIVGGAMRKKGITFIQKTIAYCTSSVFGIGDSKIHDENYNGYSDHVYLGAWKREIFSDIGYFDERLIRNQDDEFHYRAKSMGKKIFLSSSIVSEYYPRESLIKLFKQYFQYGLFKPLVLKKIKSEIKLRHIIPSLFLIYLISVPIWFLYKIFILPLVLYLLLVIFFTLKSTLPLKSKIMCLITFPVIHLSYGLGFILGFCNYDNLKKWV